MKKRIRFSGIYSIQNIVDGKQYIGSSKDMIGRWYQHRSLLRRNKHRNSHLQAAWNLFTESSFIFKILEETTSLLAREQRWIDEHHVCERDYGYNQVKFVTTPGKGRVWTKKQKEKHSERLKEAWNNPESRRRMSESTKDRYLKHPMSEETKRKISEAVKLRFQDESLRAKYSERMKKNNPMATYKHSEEQKKKWSTDRKGERNPRYGNHEKRGPYKKDKACS